MGYRDDATALQARCEVLERELAPLRAHQLQLHKLTKRRRRDLMRRRAALVLLGLRGWSRQSKLAAVLLALLIAVPLAVWYSKAAEQKREREALAAWGCRTQLTVTSSPGGAAVWTGGQLVGKTPLSSPICPGPHLIRVVHDKFLPWQRRLDVPPTGQIALTASLIPWNPAERPAGGTLLLSQPAGALAFIDGKEVGRTPVFLSEEELGRREMLNIGLWARGHRPASIAVRRQPGIWLHLAPGGAVEVDPRRGALPEPP